VNLGQLLGQLRLRIDTLEEENAELRRQLKAETESTVRSGRPLRIKEAVRAAGRWISTRELIAALAVESGDLHEEHSVYVTLSRMVERGQLARSGSHRHFRYGLPEWDTDQWMGGHELRTDQ